MNWTVLQNPVEEELVGTQGLHCASLSILAWFGRVEELLKCIVGKWCSWWVGVCVEVGVTNDIRVGHSRIIMMIQQTGGGGGERKRARMREMTSSWVVCKSVGEGERIMYCAWRKQGMVVEKVI